MLENPIFNILVFGTSLAFTLVAALVPPNAGHFIAGLFISSMGAFLGGEDEPDAYELELEDADI